MLRLQIAPAAILRQVAQPVTLPLQKEISRLADEMKSAMHYYRGIGLAAPQVNKSLRLIVVATAPHPTVYINPEIIKSSWRKVDLIEGCLSIPGVYGLVRRPQRVYVRYTDIMGQAQEEWLDDMVARIYQHEVDHLNGILFVDKAIAITSGRELLAKYGLD
jgi:peptide deformylase